MALKLYKPITPGMRGRIDLLRDEITAQKPEKSLTTGKKSNAGRDSHGVFPFGIRAVDISGSIVRSILNAISTVFRVRFELSNMIRTVVQISH